MNTPTLRIALSALLAAAPLGAAFAATMPATIVDGVTAPIQPEAYMPMSRLEAINARIAAAETNLQPTERGAYVNTAAQAQAQAELETIRNATASSEQAHGGQLTAKSYEALTAQLRNVEHLIDQAKAG